MKYFFKKLVKSSTLFRIRKNYPSKCVGWPSTSDGRRHHCKWHPCYQGNQEEDVLRNATRCLLSTPLPLGHNNGNNNSNFIIKK